MANGVDERLKHGKSALTSLLLFGTVLFLDNDNCTVSLMEN